MFQIPLPNPGKAGFFHEAMNALSEDSLNRKKQQIENQYLGAEKQAEISSKSTYAKYLPAQIMSTMMGTPAFWAAAQNNPDMWNNMQKLMMNSIDNPQLPQVKPQQDSNILNALLGKLGIGGQGDSSNAMAQGPSSSPMMSGGNVSNALSQMGTAIPTTPDNMNALKAALQGNATTPQASTPITTGLPPLPMPSNVPPMAKPGVNPFTEQQAGAAALKSGATTQAEIIPKQWEAQQKDSAQQGIDSQNTLNDLDRFSTAYDELSKYEKGFGRGSLPHVTSNAQIADQAANDLMASMLRAWHNRQITNQDLKFGQTLKVSRNLNPEAKQQMTDFFTGQSQRGQEKLAFDNAAQTLGLTVPQANILWIKYIHDKPFFDIKSKTLNDKNLNTWPNFLSQENIQKVKEGKIVDNYDRAKSAPKASDAVVNDPLGIR
jgi:hypothetical protein